jgi:hypothetical protein
VGPDGSSLSWPDNFLNLTDIGTCSYCAHTQTPYWAALIGYIGNAPPSPGSFVSASVLTEAKKIFLVGSNFSTIVSSSGILWLNFNDDAYSGNSTDNSGHVAATINIGVSRQDIVNAYANLRDAIKTAITADENTVIDLDAEYIDAVKPEWGKLAFEYVVDLSTDPVKFGVKGLALTKLLKPFHLLNTGTDIGLGIGNVMAGLGTNPSPAQIRSTLTNYYSNQVLLRSPDGHTRHTGITQILNDIDAVYADRVSSVHLPDPLPSNYPASSVVSLLQEQTAAVKASQTREVFVPDYSETAQACFAYKIGALGTNKRQMDKLVPLFQGQDTLSFYLTVSKLAVIGGGLLVKGVSALAIPVTIGGSTVPLVVSEPVVWGTVGTVLSYSEAVGAIDDVTQLTTKGAMAYVGFQGNFQAAMDILMTYQTFVDSGDWLVGQSSNNQGSVSVLSTNESNLAIINVTSPDIVFDQDQVVGHGQGTITVQNNGNTQVAASAIGDVYAVLNKTDETIVGLVSSEVVTNIPAGAQATIPFQYTVIRSSTSDPAGYQLRINVEWTDPNGEIQFVMPTISHFYAGTTSQLAALNVQSFSNPFTGQLPAGLQSSTSITTQGNVSKLRLGLFMNDGSHFDLHLYDNQGRHTGIKYNTGEVETGIPGSTYSGTSSSPQWISVAQAGGQTYKIVVVAINTDGGQTFNVSAVETPVMPALVDIPPKLFLSAGVPDTNVDFSLPIREYGNSAGVSNLRTSISDLAAPTGVVISNKLINLALPTSIAAGSIAVASGVVNFGTLPPAGEYSGTITISGVDSESGAGVTETTRVILQIQSPQIFLPMVVNH